MSGGPVAEPQTTERRSAATWEAGIVVTLGLASLWLIRAQTTQGPVLGLPPAFLPTVCAIAIIALALLGLAVRLWRPESLRVEQALHSWPAALLLGLAMAGTLVLQLAGPFAGGLVIVALGLVLLGERRLPILIGTMTGAVLVLGVVFHLWQ